MRCTTALAFAAALCLLSACSAASPTAPEELRRDDSPYTMGSGTRTNASTDETVLPMGGNVAGGTPAASGHPIGTGN
jgi:hypothetical protein